MKRLLQALARVVLVFDWPLMIILALLATLGLVIMHSAVGGTEWRFADQSRNFLIAFACMWVMAMLPLPALMKLTLPMYAAGVMLLPSYIPTRVAVDNDIEEWSAPEPSQWMVLTPKGMAATMLEPNEVLGGGKDNGVFRRLGDVR